MTMWLHPRGGGRVQNTDGSSNELYNTTTRSRKAAKAQRVRFTPRQRSACAGRVETRLGFVLFFTSIAPLRLCVSPVVFTSRCPRYANGDQGYSALSATFRSAIFVPEASPSAPVAQWIERRFPKP